MEDDCEAIRTMLSKGRPGETYNVGARSDRRSQHIDRHMALDVRCAKPHQPRLDCRLLWADRDLDCGGCLLPHVQVAARQFYPVVAELAQAQADLDAVTVS